MVHWLERARAGRLLSFKYLDNAADPLFVALASAVTFMLSACAPVQESSAAAGPSPAIDVTHSAADLHVDLARNPLLIQDASDCDRRNAKRVRAITAELDRRRAEIEAFEANLGDQDTGYVRSQLGPLRIKYPARSVEPRPGWLTREASWENAFKLFRRISGRATDVDWVNLNSAARSLLLDDVYRVQQKRNYALTRTDGPRIRELYQALRASIDRDPPALPAIEPALRKWAESIPLYREPLRQIGTSSGEARRSALQKLEQRLALDRRYFEFTRNEQLTRAGDRQFKLKLFAGPFGDVTSKLDELIDNYWTVWNDRQPEWQVSIEWVRAEDRQLWPGLFGLSVGEGPGERSFVSRDRREAVLFNDLAAPGLAHELGHIVGFPDHYHYVYDEARCRYVETYREDDIMSSPYRGGRVTADEWATLDQEYPL